MEDRYLFFSIVVPAHNEEKYIEQTLMCLVALDYPKDRYEVIVVENGSTDRTLEKATPFEKGNIRVLSYKERGVSFARNRGSESCRSDGDWVLFLDADTHLAPTFLRELDALIRTHGYAGYATGVFRVLPESSDVLTNLLFPWANFWRSITHSLPYSVFLIRRDVVGHVHSDEGRQVAEDLAFVKDAQRHGRSFYMHTSTVRTSTRRFEQEGWLRMIVLWLSVMPLSAKLQRLFNYRVVR